jgi:hypothetical protein
MDILYHYCPARAFHSIIQNKEIWLSSLSLSNDYKEGLVFYEKIISMLRGDADIDTDKKEFILNAFDKLRSEYDSFAFCLSQKKDMLSQWRGYADDGCGFSIGFAINELKKLLSTKESEDLNAVLRNVIYDQSKADKVTYSAFNRIKEVILRDADNIIAGVDLSAFKLNIFIEICRFEAFLLKNKAFEEEEESRLICNRKNADINHGLKYRESKSKIIPYYTLSLGENNENCIHEVYIGPKNKTPVHIVHDFLRLRNFSSAVVYQSSASYH